MEVKRWEVLSMCQCSGEEGTGKEGDEWEIEKKVVIE